jgi:hydrophobe/amphiphile efflux-1 (HAE1) family protein
MRFGQYFIGRPRFAAVISIVITLVGAIAYFRLPVAQYPEVVPPTIVVNARYPGASPEVIAQTVAAPIEEEVNGVEGMLYMTSSSTVDGVMQLVVTFDLGIDLDTAQVLVENRVSVAEPRLPEETRRLGVIVEKSSPDLMMVVHMDSPDQSLDALYVSNYALLNVRDVLARIDGVGRIGLIGIREYGMRIWLDPERMAGLRVTAGEVLAALRGENVQVVGGALGLEPMPLPGAFQVTVAGEGRLESPEQFGAIIVSSSTEGRLVRLRDIARVELQADRYITESLLDGRPAIALAMFQRPGSNAVATSQAITRAMAELGETFPPGLRYQILYNPTEYISESIRALYWTLLEASALVIIVILLFLQNWRAAIIPILAIPVSLIGTFAVMDLFGVSLNNLSLFGLVLAIGIVVDDAIVVVENIERNLARGLSPREASSVTMNEVGAALVSIGLVLTSVFIPTAFLGGITGEMFRQFALTIATATAISVLNSLTLSPALAAVLLKPHGGPPDRIDLAWNALLGWLFRAFNRGFGALSDGYARLVGRLVRRPAMALASFVLMLGLTAAGLAWTPTGFIPALDQGYLIVIGELPKGASLERTREVVLETSEIAKRIPDTTMAFGFAGFSVATSSNTPQSATVFVGLEDFARRRAGLSGTELGNLLQAELSGIQEASLLVVEPPPIRGIGSGGDFKMLVRDRSGQGFAALEQATWALAGAAAQAGIVNRAFTTFSNDAPRWFVEVDRTRAEMLNVPIANVFEALRVFLGSDYVNDFSLFGRNYRVTVQADAPFRFEPDNITRLRAANASGQMVPLGSIVSISPATGPDRVVRHNLYPAAELQFSVPPGGSSGQALDGMERLAAQVLPAGFDFEWTELAYQQQTIGGLGLLVFPLGVLFVFLVLSAQYESWSLPIVIVLIVPLVLLFALAGLALRGMDLNILAQIGFVVLVGLASKNAVLIVEFARQREAQGADRFTAAIEAARLRLRPILMTSFAFIMGVVPLAIATGAGAEMRRVMGTVVFSGMLGVTIVGLLLTPVFYVVTRGLLERGPQPASLP